MTADDRCLRDLRALLPMYCDSLSQYNVHPNLHDRAMLRAIVMLLARCARVDEYTLAVMIPTMPAPPDPSDPFAADPR